jgi:hypothetical protein
VIANGAVVEQIDAAAAEVERLRKALTKSDRRQVRANDEQLAVKSTLAWFRSHKPTLVGAIQQSELENADAIYLRLLEASDRQASRDKIFNDLRSLRQRLTELRTLYLARGSQQVSEEAPDLSSLVTDERLRAILVERWNKCARCLRAPAPLAATVMMGGLLEGLLLARIDKESNKKPVFTARAAPKDRSGKTQLLKEWVLYDFLAVAHELGWITPSAQSIGHALRDYRNYIHPQKQLTDTISLSPDDAALWWEMIRAIARELLR